MSRFLHGYHARANGVRQHLLRHGGQGPRMLLLPGITSPAITWGFVAERLAQHYDVHVLDFRGRGLSESRPGLVIPGSSSIRGPLPPWRSRCCRTPLARAW